MHVPRFEAAYPIAMLLAIAAFWIVRRWQPSLTPSAQLTVVQKLYLALIAFVGGSLGSKLPFVIAKGHLFSSEAWLADGKTITAALVGAYIAVELAKPILGVRFKTGDDYALPLAVALFIGRWGCFFNGCCYGGETELPWGVVFETLPGIRHPIQLYEVLFHALAAGLLVFLIQKRLCESHRLQLYLIAYCMFRWSTEFLRPEPIWAFGMTAYQWAVLGFGLALALQWRLESRAAAKRKLEPQAAHHPVPPPATPRNP